MSTLTVSERNDLVSDTIDLVGHIVAELSSRYPRHVDRQELWNAGALGLVEASRRFDPASGVPFARYAAIRIKGAIIDSTRSRDWSTRSVRRSLRELRQAAGLLEERGQRPTNADLARSMGVTTRDVARYQAELAASTLLQLDQPVDGEDATLGNRVEEPRADAVPELALERREVRGTLAAAVRNLPDTMAEVITRYYLDGELMQDIADHLGITEARVSQIRSEALNAMRAYFGTVYDGVEPSDAGAPGKRAREAYLERMVGEVDWRTRIDAAGALDAALAGLTALVEPA